MITDGDLEARKQLLLGWLGSRLTPKQSDWVAQRRQAIMSDEKIGTLAAAIGLASRKVGKSDLALTPAEIKAARAVRPNLDPSDWSIDQAARILFTLDRSSIPTPTFAESLDRLWQTTEIAEQIALLRGLPLYPFPESCVPRAAEGLRSAMQPVFEAVAHRNPFPFEQFSETQWNQMVLKALFIGSPLAPIQGLDQRRNPELAATLMDYVHERWAAGRAVSPELWRCVGPFARREDIADMAPLLHANNTAEAAAAALALSECQLPEARDTLSRAPSLCEAVKKKTLTWDTIEPQ
jgi:hypothetical protein